MVFRTWIAGGLPAEPDDTGVLPRTTWALPGIDRLLTPLRSRLWRQHLAVRLGCQRNDEKADDENDRRQRNGQTQRMCVQNRRAEQEVDARTDKTAERGAECKRRRAHARLELLGQPEAEERKVAAEETEHEQPRDERREPVGQIERPAKAADNRDRHPR